MVLLTLFQRRVLPRFAIPPGERVYAIGDVHGRVDLLDRLLGKIDADSEARGKADCWTIFLGDLINRGPDSRAVLERGMALARSKRACIFLLGNHEEMLLRLWRGESRVAGGFLNFGGDKTLISYGLGEAEAAALSHKSVEEIVQIVRRLIPEVHIRFLERFGNLCRFGDYVFVHAGVRPGIAIEDQDGLDLRWIRRDFTQSTSDFGAMIIHGHSMVKKPAIRANRIGIDTGAYASGVLTAIGLQGTERWFLTS